MFYIYKLWFITIFLANNVICNVLPLEKCDLKDTSCLVSTAQKIIPEFTEGLPELGVDRLDVLDFDDVAFDLSGFQFSLKNGKLAGLKNSIVDNIIWDVSKQRLSLSFHMDCDLEGNYIAGGKLLLLPITGDGIMYLKLKNYSINLHMDYELKNMDGKDFTIIKKYEYDYDVIENAHFHLTNLFNGNEQLSKTMLSVINTNWKQLTIDFGRPIIDVVVKKLVKNVGQFLKKNALVDIAIIS